MGRALNHYGYTADLVWLKDLLYGISYAPQHQENICFYLLLHPHKANSFKTALKKGKKFNLQEYATLINPDKEEFPTGLKEQLRIKYNAII